VSDQRRAGEMFMGQTPCQDAFETNSIHRLESRHSLPSRAALPKRLPHAGKETHAACQTRCWAAISLGKKQKQRFFPGIAGFAISRPGADRRSRDSGAWGESTQGVGRFAPPPGRSRPLPGAIRPSRWSDALPAGTSHGENHHVHRPAGLTAGRCGTGDTCQMAAPDRRRRPE
jgi:hypothetical protein